MKRKLAIVALMTLAAAGYAQAFWTPIALNLNADFNYTLTGYKVDIQGPVNDPGQVIATFNGPTFYPNRPDLGWLSNHHWYCADIPQPFGNTADRSFYWTDDPSAGPQGRDIQGSVAGNRRAAWILNRWSYGATTAYQKTALQLAVWEAIYDNNNLLDFADGNFKTNNFRLNNDTAIDQTAMINAAKGYYAGSQEGSGIYAWDSQNLLRGVPEPGTLILLGVGLLGPGIASLRRRRSR